MFSLLMEEDIGSFSFCYWCLDGQYKIVTHHLVLLQTAPELQTVMMTVE